MAFSGDSWGDRQCDRNWKAQRFGLYLIYSNTGMVEDEAGVHHQISSTKTISELRQEIGASYNQCRSWLEVRKAMTRWIAILKTYNGEHDFLLVKVDQNGQHIIEQ